MSNNLFGSARFKDQSYIRSVAQKKGSNRSLRSTALKQSTEQPESKIVSGPANPAASLAEDRSYDVDEVPEERRDEEEQVIGQAISPLELHEPPNEYSDEEEEQSRPVTPPDGGNDYLVDDFPPVEPLSPRSPRRSAMSNGMTTPLASPPSSPFPPARHRHPGQLRFTPTQVQRASLALEEVIRNFEQDKDAEEEILTPRTPNGGFAINSYTRSAHPWVKQQHGVSFLFRR